MRGLAGAHQALEEEGLEGLSSPGMGIQDRPVVSDLTGAVPGR